MIHRYTILTLLTTGMLDALLHSYADGGKRIDTPHLAIRYEPADWPFAMFQSLTVFPAPSEASR